MANSNDVPRVVAAADDRWLAWLDARRAPVQLGVAVGLGLPWLAVALWGLRWGWLVLAVLPVAAYLMLVTVFVEREEPDGVEG